MNAHGRTKHTVCKAFLLWARATQIEEVWIFFGKCLYNCSGSTRVRSIKHVFEQESSDSDADEIQKHRRGVSTAASTSVNSDRHSLATSDQVCAVLCIRSTTCSVFNSTFGLLLTTRISLQVEQVRLELSKVREQLAQVLTHSHVLER